MAGIEVKNEKHKARNEYFPRNSRFIPEWLNSPIRFPKIYRFITEKKFEKAWLAVITVIMIVAIVVIAKDLENSMHKKNLLDQQRANILTKIHKWQQVVQEYPDYRDGYFELATLEYQAGDIAGASSAINKTLALDPNFKQTQALGKILEIKRINN